MKRRKGTLDGNASSHENGSKGGMGMELILHEKEAGV